MKLALEKTFAALPAPLSCMRDSDSGGPFAGIRKLKTGPNQPFLSTFSSVAARPIPRQLDALLRLQESRHCRITGEFSFALTDRGIGPDHKCP